MSHILLLASKSYSRKMLLEEARIPFRVIEQEADEAQCDWLLPLPELVQQIALSKMQHAILPDGVRDQERCFVLTADTLSQDMSDGAINGKPLDRADAINKIKKARMGTVLYTAFCLNRYAWRNNQWCVEQAHQEVVRAEYRFYIPDNIIDWYIDNSVAMSASNAIAVEGLGAQFLQSVIGSHSAIIGLPLFEVRRALEICGFYRV